MNGKFYGKITQNCGCFIPIFWMTLALRSPGQWKIPPKIEIRSSQIETVNRRSHSESSNQSPVWFWFPEDLLSLLCIYILYPSSMTIYHYKPCFSPFSHEIMRFLHFQWIFPWKTAIFSGPRGRERGGRAVPGLPRPALWRAQGGPRRPGQGGKCWDVLGDVERCVCVYIPGSSKFC